MMDNTNNAHGVAPDEGTLNGPVSTKANETYLLDHKGKPNLTSLHLNPRMPNFLEDRQSSDYWLADITYGILIRSLAFGMSFKLTRQMPFQQPQPYTFFRNVMDYGAKGDGVSEDSLLSQESL
jgi:hypothetical protein